jgi:hypothetical protein
MCHTNNSDSHYECKKLINAIIKSDENELDNLREKYETIKDHFHQCTDCYELGESLSPELKPVLIIWLTTPPDDEPINWLDFSEPTFLVDERERFTYMINSMWDSWAENTIIDKIEKSVEDEMRRRTANEWIADASDWFQEFERSKNWILSKTEDIRTRVDLTSGYGNFIDDLLLKEECDITEAKIFLQIEDHKPILISQQGHNIPVAQIANSISFRAFTDIELSNEIAKAISFSLPAHLFVLPTINVKNVANGCELTSLWEDPFA